MRKATEASTRATNIAAEALKSSNESFQKTFAQMQAQTDQTRRLADESWRSANSSDKAVGVARQSLELQGRPWVGFGRFIFPKVETGSVLPFTVSIQNFGSSPAVHVHFSVHMRLICGPFPAKPVYGDTGEASYTTLMPREGINGIEGRQPQPVTKEAIDLLTAGKCSLYVFGIVQYRDIFRREHYRHHCSVWLPKTNEFQICSVYNDGDEDYGVK